MSRVSYYYNFEYNLSYIRMDSCNYNFKTFAYRFTNHMVLNSRYLMLSLLGKGGFSEVLKVHYSPSIYLRLLSISSQLVLY